MSIRGNWDRRISRRNFLGLGGMSAVAFALGSKGALAQSNGGSGFAGYGDLVPDPGGVLNLPPGFQYRAFSSEGETLSNGAPVPGDHDGMAAFQGEGGTTVLVRNHELDMDDTDAEPVTGSRQFDSGQPGGTTGLVIGPDRKLIKDYVTSSGTQNNCSGGPTPWGTWLTCEEARDEGHGYVFEVDPNDPENELSAAPIKEMGFFSHEAVGIDPSTGIVYLTEDDFRGIIDEKDPRNDTRSSFLYRYLPNDTTQRPGALQKGGKLQALAIDEVLRDADFYNQAQKFQVRWIDVSAEKASDDALYGGAVRFNRLEGAHFVGGAFWFDDTAGGEARLGQVYRYIPATQTLELFFEATDANNMDAPDNVTVTPWGDVWFAEDGDGENRVMGVTPEGAVYKFASHSVPLPGGEPGELSEFAGPTFSPDGQTFFLNIQNPGITFAIWGPFSERASSVLPDTGGMPVPPGLRGLPAISPSRQRQMSYAAPPARFAPRISGEVAEAAERYGMSLLEAAAYDRFGVPLA